MTCHRNPPLINNNTKTEYTSFDTYPCLLFHIIVFDIKALVVPITSLCIPSSYHVAADRILQGLIIYEAFTSKILIHFWKQEDVRRCQVRVVRRMLEEVTMELLKQQDLCLPSCMRTCIVVQQNNSTQELASSAR